MRKDLKSVEVGEDEWYEEAMRSRTGWRALYLVEMWGGEESTDSVVVRDVVCQVCSRSFRRESDKKRHKCVAERQRPVCEQRGAAQCTQCQRWFRRLAVHRYMPEA